MAGISVCLIVYQKLVNICQFIYYAQCTHIHMYVIIGISTLSLVSIICPD